MATRKTLSLPSANSPQPLRYASGKPPVPASIEQRPADDGSMSDGTTGGNFQTPTVATGAGQAQQGLDISDSSK